MQPYLFPFIHYFRLIAAVDLFVLYDDVSYRKQGYINRNVIALHGKPARFTVPVLGASSHKNINELFVSPARDGKILTTMKHAYGGAPGFPKVYPLIEQAILHPDKLLSSYATCSIETMCAYLGIKTPMLLSSSIEKDPALHGQARVIDICTRLDANTYINLSGGKILYDPEAFARAGMRLEFLESTPALSIIDDAMRGLECLS